MSTIKYSSITELNTVYHSALVNQLFVHFAYLWLRKIMFTFYTPILFIHSKFVQRVLKGIYSAVLFHLDFSKVDTHLIKLILYFCVFLKNLIRIWQHSSFIILNPTIHNQNSLELHGLRFRGHREKPVHILHIQYKAADQNGFQTCSPWVSTTINIQLSGK